MKSTIKASTYRAIYRLLDRVSPIVCDCGTLCGAVCCTNGKDDDMGIYLLPGEEKIHVGEDDWLIWTKDRAQDYDFPKSWSGTVYFVKCKTPPHCPREKRPIQCRTYPLAPHICEDGELLMVYNDIDTPYRCPLIDEEIPLNDDFVQATQTVWAHLLRDPKIYDLVREDSIRREEAVAELYEMLEG